MNGDPAQQGRRTILAMGAVQLATASLAATLGAGVGRAQLLTLELRNSVPIASTATDQFGQSFTVTGMSGIARLVGDEYLAVMDNSNKLVRIRVEFADDGAITAATITSGVRLAESRDFEGIAVDAVKNVVFLSEEGTPAVHEYDLKTGARLRSFPTPPVFSSRRANNGFESLARAALPVGRGELWTANEEALSVDGPASTPTAGTVVRLLLYRYTPTTADPVAQYAYLTQPMHGVAISGAKSGLSDLLVLPDGRLLALERSLALSASGLFQTRIYELDFAGSTDVAGLTAGLIGQTYTPVSKRLLWSGSLNNLEGLALGPALRDDRRVLLGVVDDGDPVSLNAIAAFELTGGIKKPAELSPAPPSGENPADLPR